MDVLSEPLQSPLVALGSQSPKKVGSGVAFDASSLFTGGHKGVLYWLYNKDKLHKDTARTQLVTTAGDLVRSVTDDSGNNYHAQQSGTSTVCPAWNNGRVEFASGDWLKAVNVDFSGTDVVTVVMAVYKANDTSYTAMLEHGMGNSGTDVGFRVSGPPYNGGGGFGAACRGTNLVSAQNAPGTPAPVYAVVTAIFRRGSDTCLIRVNGEVKEVSISVIGAGNFTLNDLYLNASAGTNLFFGGNLYAVLAIDKELKEVELNNTEKQFASLLPGPVVIGAPKFTLAVIGDSYSTIGTGVNLAQTYTKILDARIARIIRSENLGQSGNSSANVYARRMQLIRVATPNEALIEIGQNDQITTTVSASPSPTTTGCTLAGTFGLAVEGWILLDGVQTQIATLVGNAITYAPRAVPAAGALVAVDTRKNIAETCLFLKAAGCLRIGVLGLHYCNTLTGGDTVAAQETVNATIRNKQQGAAIDAGVEYIDLYGPGRQRIIAGLNTQGDSLWHLSTTDRHLNQTGHIQLYADPIEAFFTAMGWV